MCLGEINPILRDILNPIVNNKLEEYVVEFEESTLKGDNFLSDIGFLCLKNKKNGEKLHLVVKQVSEAMNKIDNLKSVYSTEIHLYDKLWPILNKFQKNHSIGFDKIAKLYGYNNIPGKERLVLEDLRQQQFKLRDKTAPLDDQHCRLIFESYGIFHAISYAYREENPEEFKELTKNLKGMYDLFGGQEGLEKFGETLKENLNFAIDLLGEGDEELTKILEKHKENPVKYFKIDYTGNNPVLTHGDCWSNNMMFKYNDKKEVIDMRFLDFQLTIPGSPVMDLSYSFYSGSSADIIDNFFDYLKLYHDSFTATLDKLECKPVNPYTFEMLREEWKRYCGFGFYMSLLIWRMKFLDKNDIPTVGDAPGLRSVGKEYVDIYNAQIKGLVTHLYKNDYL